mgnify:FL=1
MAAYTTIDDSSAHFQVATYTGNGGTISVTNDGNSDLQPDFVWIHNRNTYQPQIYDTSRGVHKKIMSSVANAESTDTTALTAFNSDGFSTGANIGVNQNSVGHVAWQWKANGGTTSTNTDGTINSSVQVNSDAGFSIMTYTGTGAELPGIGHGLDAAADIYLQKNRSNSASWAVLGKTVSAPSGGNRYLLLNETNAEGGASQGPGNATTIQTWSDATGNASGDEYVVYAFTSKQGFSSINYYTGTGNANGPFVYTGFKPAWVMIKGLTVADDWYIFDNKRLGYNPAAFRLRANTNAAETTGTDNTIDFLSNGFKLRFSGGSMNGSGSTYIYMAFAENPFVTSTGVPTTAR